MKPFPAIETMRSRGIRISLLTLYAVLSAALAGSVAQASGLDATPSLQRATSTDKPPSPQGFIQRWMLLEPIGAVGLTDKAVRETVAKAHFTNQLAVLPRDGEKVKVGDGERTWHAVDTKEYNVNLFHFAWALEKPTSNILTWGVTVLNCPEEIQDVRLAIGSNAASIWWLNGQELVGIYGDRQTVIDDGVSKRVTLKKGTNVLRCAVINGGGATDFCARFLTEDGKPVLGYTVSVPGVSK